MPKVMAIARKIGLAAAGLYGAALVLGVGYFACHRPEIVTPPLAIRPAPGERTNLASYYNGASVAVSSFDAFNRHHPLYAIDGRDQPGTREKWCRSQHDSRPWLEVRLAQPAVVDALRVAFTAANEKNVPAPAAYDIVCERGDDGTVVNTLPVRGNTDPIRSHELLCAGADRVRVVFPDPPDRPEVVGVYEIEVFGKVDTT